jgi:hypothetical protein
MEFRPPDPQGSSAVLSGLTPTLSLYKFTDQATERFRKRRGIRGTTGTIGKLRLETNGAIGYLFSPSSFERHNSPALSRI